MERWQRLKRAASRIIVAQGGTISHQHGVGMDHAPYLAAEKGQVGLQVLADVGRSLDPDGIMNPGKLLVRRSVAWPNYLERTRTNADKDGLY